MKRKLYEDLIKWKDSKNRKPLILEGARQVGKTWLLKEFGKKEYKNMVYVNCSDNSFAKELFKEDLLPQRIIRDLEAYSAERIKEEKTLIFFDEIQESPYGITSLKYFCEKAPQYHVVVAGSLLGVTHRPGESYPVGKVDLLRLHPMTFEEFLWAKEEIPLSEAIHNCEWDVVEATKSKCQNLLREYYFVGGMPEAVLAFVSRGHLIDIRTIQHNILQTYMNDMAKHAGKDTERVRMVWQSIPGQMAKENKKFIYGAVKKGGRAKDFETAIQWLVDAGLVYKIHKCKTPIAPLKFYEDFDAFKLYMLDVGLLGALSQTDALQILTSNNIFSSYKGAFTENYVLEQLIVNQRLPIYYYSKDNSQVEVDFLIQAGGKVIPMEVKAEENVKSKSLAQFVKEDFAPMMMKGVRFSMKGYIDQTWMENIPLYCAGTYTHRLVDKKTNGS